MATDRTVERRQTGCAYASESDARELRNGSYLVDDVGRGMLSGSGRRNASEFDVPGNQSRAPSPTLPTGTFRMFRNC